MIGEHLEGIGEVLDLGIHIGLTPWTKMKRESVITAENQDNL